MATYQAQNKRVISQAFSRFRKEDERIIEEGMIRVAKAGLDFLIEAHEHHPYAHRHPEEVDTMAYAIAHNGAIVASQGYNGNGDDLPGNAQEAAERLLAGSIGWTAIVLSDMEGWYRVDWEWGFLQYSSDEIKENFNKYFKPIR